MEFDETQRFWYPRVAHDAWINFAFCSNKTYSLVSVNLREKWNPFFFFLSFSCSFLPSFSLPLLSFFYSFIFLLIHLHFLLLFVLILLSFSFSFSSFPFYFLFFFFTLLPVWIKVGETSHHFPPLTHVTFTFFLDFSLIFLYFSFIIFPPLDTWLNVSNSHKCTTWLMPCVTPLGCHVAST